jgi:hypothetical protein
MTSRIFEKDEPDIYAYNCEGGTFEIDPSYADAVYPGSRDDVEELNEHQFNKYIQKPRDSKSNDI